MVYVNHLLVRINVAVPNLEVELTIRIRANPRLEMHRGALAAEVGERNQVTITTHPALGKI